MKPACVQPVTLSRMGFENNLAQMSIMTKQCVLNENHVTRSKVMVTVRTQTLCVGFSEVCLCLTHYFVKHGKIYK